MKTFAMMVVVLSASSAFASDDLCATRAVQCLSACTGDAICVSKCSRYQSTCEKNRATSERISAPKKCFDQFGSPIRCEVNVPRPEPIDPVALEKLAAVVKVPSQKAWKDDAKPAARSKVIEVR